MVGEVPAVDSLTTRPDAGTPFGPNATQGPTGGGAGDSSSSGEFALVRMAFAAARAFFR